MIFCPYRVFRVVDRIDDFVVWMNLVSVLIEFGCWLNTFTICFFVTLNCSCVCSSPAYCHSLWVACIMHSGQMTLSFNDWNNVLGVIGSKVCNCSKHYCCLCSEYLLRVDCPGGYELCSDYVPDVNGATGIVCCIWLCSSDYHFVLWFAKAEAHSPRDDESPGHGMLP